MPKVEINPGLSAWQVRRRNRVRRITGNLILLCGLAGAALYVVPAQHNPLVHAGVLRVETAPLAQVDVTIPTIALTIPVTEKQLPKTRPSIAAARTADDLEAAQVIGAVPLIRSAEPDPRPVVIIEVTGDLNVSGSSSPMLSVIDDERITGALPPREPDEATPPRAPERPVQAVQPAARKKPATASSGNETLDQARKRVFTSDR